ncbi:hypothetical protein AVEN_148625-1 [Araneus ventricosus]|uniref:Uncharacterized protein n=1 Tax=Araneus ventricosus TaxID=182803 RepID=A0A4Y2UV91_ARAVE|nr:hypothetical protein AVEN_148625-1 [Araneus ventricosus]
MLAETSTMRCLDAGVAKADDDCYSLMPVSKARRRLLHFWCAESPNRATTAALPIPRSSNRDDDCCASVMPHRNRDDDSATIRRVIKQGTTTCCTH